MSEPGQRIGDRIRERRGEAKLSISALADRAKVSKGYLWSLEKGETDARPSGRTLYKIAEALGTTMSDLLGEELLADPAPADEIPPELAAFAKSEGLTKPDIRMLAAVNFRGQRPQDADGWRLVWGAIKASVR